MNETDFFLEPFVINYLIIESKLVRS